MVAVSSHGGRVKVDRRTKLVGFIGSRSDTGNLRWQQFGRWTVPGSAYQRFPPLVARRHLVVERPHVLPSLSRNAASGWHYGDPEQAASAQAVIVSSRASFFVPVGSCRRYQVNSKAK